MDGDTNEPLAETDATVKLSSGESQSDVNKDAAEDESRHRATSFSSDNSTELQVLVHDVKEEEVDSQLSINVPESRGVGDFRAGYLRRLKDMKVWTPPAQRPPKHQTVCIFDWDDTLLCTTFLNSCPGGKVPPDAQQQMRAIAGNVNKLLDVSLRMGHTFIITNAMSGWVEFSAETWIPEVLPTLRKVQIISARTRYENYFPDEGGKWKEHAFLDVQQQLNADIVTNLFAIGDSDAEMNAAHVMRSKFAQALIKTVRLKRAPSPLELTKQLDLIAPKFEHIINSGRALTIQCERRGDGQAKKIAKVILESWHNLFSELSRHAANMVTRT